MKELSNVAGQFQESIFATLSKKAQQAQAINLAQGFPDFEAPSFLLEQLKKSFHGAHNQYSPLAGDLKLRENLSKLHQHYYRSHYCPENEITITHGATEAIFVSIMALCNPGDEVIVLEPFYDSYIASIKLAGATPVPVTLHAPNFHYQLTELQNAFSAKTKLLILNNPHNPSGKVFTPKELQEISKLVIKNDCYLLSDEVYEFLLFDQLKHTPIATLEKMKERTITVSSMGKTFGATGLKIGWAMAEKPLSQAIRAVHQFCTFSAHHPTQHALKEVTELSFFSEYIDQFQKQYQQKRDDFFQQLCDMGATPFLPTGSYFIMCPIPEKYQQQFDDIQFSDYMIEKCKVAAIPPSAFYLKSQDGQKYQRFCFAKKEETLKQAARQLKSLF